MTCYSYGQLEALWIQAGGPASVAPVAAAIALAESGGCTTAMNYTDNNGTQTSVGIWQVSNGTHSYPSAWTTAAGNAAEAVAKYNAAGGFSPWGTYDSGAYKPYLNTSTSPDSTGVGTGADLTSAETTSQDATCLWQVSGLNLGFATLGGGCIISKSQARAILGGLFMWDGAIICLVGIAILVASGFQKTGAGRAAGQVAGTAAEIGGAAASVAGFPEVGAPIAATGSAIKGKASAAGRVAQSSAQQKRARQADQRAQERHDEAMLKAASTPRTVQGRTAESYDVDPVPF